MSSSGSEVLESLRGVRVRAEATRDEDPEPRLDRAVVGCAGNAHHADVVEHRLAAVRSAAREVDLELAGQALGVRMAEEVLEGRLRPGAHIQCLEWARPGQVARGHIPHRVTAGLAGREADRGHVPEHRRDLLELDKVELHVLAGSDVPPAARIGLGHVSEGL